MRVAGCDPRALGARARRRLLGMVPQQGHLFAGTVAENITLNDPELTVEDVRCAAELAGAHAFITALPRGYDTPIGAGGLALSAGQQQLLALTRALAANPPVLLLDEATSALDADTDAAVRRALRAGQTGRTTLTVAHRLSTARDADRILVMEEGVIVEAGAPDALRTAGGRYAAWEELAAWYGDEVFQRLS
jgi:ATP-binding cassette subfamily B protein